MVRRHGLTPQQLFTWQREARQRLEPEAPPAFAPAVIMPEPVKRSRVRRGPAGRRWAAIAIDVDGVKVTIENGASPATMAAAIGA